MNHAALRLTAECEALRRGDLERIFRYPFQTDPSDLQAAILRAADGRSIGPELSDAEVRRFFGCERSRIGLSVPLLVVIVAGIRSGKSLLAATAAVAKAMTADMSRIKKHLIPKVRIVCPKAENAIETFRHILGAIEESPALRSRLDGEPRWSPHPSLVLNRFDGRQVQVSVGAADSGGLSMRSGWMAGFVLDEAALFGEAAGGAAVNAEEIVNAAETRVLPSGQGWIVSSPYGPTGLLYGLYTKHFGKPGRTLVVRAPTIAMNPHFPRDLIDAIRLEKPDVAAREYDAEWVDADSAFFEGVLVDKSVRLVLEIPPQDGGRYLAAMDAGTRGNAWTLVIARDVRAQGDRVAKIEVSHAEEWIGSRQKPLDPAEILAKIKAACAPYGVSTVNCDAYALDPLRSVAKSVGLRLNEHTFRGEQKTEVYRAVDALLRQERLDLPPLPAVIRDLKSIRRRATAGQILPYLPQTSDGRHCDYAPAISLAVWLLAGHSFSQELSAAMKRLADDGGPEGFFN